MRLQSKTILFKIQTRILDIIFYKKGRDNGEVEECSKKQRWESHASVLRWINTGIRKKNTS